jgi:23S rRNA (guanosine2251-2'-O)-methyltransferase
MERESNSKKVNQQVIYGLHPVMEAIKSGKEIDKVLIQNGASGALISELRGMVKEYNIPFQFVPIEKLNRTTRNGNHQGVVAVISPINYFSIMDLIPTIQAEGKVPFILMLDKVTDVRNLGAIARTAECVGADAIVVPTHGSAAINDDAIKSSSGALLRVPICREDNLKTVINFAKQSGLQVCAATEKGSVNYTQVDFTLPTMLIMGAEDTGVSNEYQKMSNVKAKLPLKGNVESLNVSVAAGVFMYEVLRQREIGN